MFVRGGVYRVVKEAMGGTLAKLSVSALMFDYVLTGPISGVSAGQYIVGLANELLRVLHVPVAIPTAAGSAAIAIAITLYFWRQNILGIQESSDKALKIMGVTTVMVVVMIVWCGVTSGCAARRCRRSSCTSATTSLGWLGGTGWEQADRRARHPHRLRPLDPGHERRGDARPGLPRGRVPKLKNLSAPASSSSSTACC